MNIVCIYKIECLIDNRIYIGKTKNFKSRKTDHLSRLRRDIHPNIHLQRAWNKYGEENFVICIIESCDYSKLDVTEKKLGDLYEALSRKKGYNIRPFLTDGKFILSERTKKKMSIAKKGRKKDPSVTKQQVETRKITYPNLSPTHKSNISKKLVGNKNSLGCKKSEKEKLEISIRSKKLMSDPIYKQKLFEKVRQKRKIDLRGYSETGEELCRFHSFTAASLILNIGEHRIRDNAKGKSKKFYLLVNNKKIKIEWKKI